MAQQEQSGMGIAEPAMRYYNPQTGIIEMARTPTKFPSASVTTAASTTIWTPTSGNRFRLLGYSLILTGNATISVGGINTLTFLDGATPIGHLIDFFIPALTVSLLGGPASITYTLPGNGYLSKAINSSLNVTLSANLTGGSLRVNLSGCEETS